MCRVTEWSLYRVIALVLVLVLFSDGSTFAEEASANSLESMTVDELAADFWALTFHHNPKVIQRMVDIGREMERRGRRDNDQYLIARGLSRHAYAIHLNPRQFASHYNIVAKDVRAKMKRATEMTAGAITNQQLAARSEVLIFDSFLVTLYADVRGLSRAKHFELGTKLMLQALSLAWRSGEDLTLTGVHRLAHHVHLNNSRYQTALSHAMQMRRYAERTGDPRLIDCAMSLELRAHANLNTLQSDEATELLAECAKQPPESLANQIAAPYLPALNSKPLETHEFEATYEKLRNQVRRERDPLEVCNFLVDAREYLPNDQSAEAYAKKLDLAEFCARLATHSQDLIHVRKIQFWRIQLLAEGDQFQQADQLAEELYHEATDLRNHHFAHDVALVAVESGDDLSDERKAVWSQRTKDMARRLSNHAASAIREIANLHVTMEGETREARSREQAEREAKKQAALDLATNANERLKAEGAAKQARTRTRYWQLGTLSTLLAAGLVITGMQTWQARQQALKLEQQVQSRTADLEQAKLQADDANRAKGEFLAWVNHELRSPIAAVNTCSELLAVPGIEERFRETCVDTIAAGSRHLTELIERVLDFSRLDAATIEINASEFFVESIIDEVCRMLRRSTSRRAITVDAFIEQSARTLIRGDQTKLRQILMNLGTNAIKHTQAGTVTVSGRIEVDDSGQHRLYATVTDTGAGIPPSLQENLFRPFTTGNKDLDAKKGTGLGLYICQSLVDCLGGQISVRSTVGQGSTFEFWFPVEIVNVTSPAGFEHHSLPHLPSSPHRREPLIPGGLPDQSLPPTMTSSQRVLSIDDNPLVLDSNRTLLQLMGFTCYTAVDWEEAEVLIRQFSPNIILTDLSMPIMDGFEVLKRINKMDLIPRPSIFAITGSADPETAQQVHQAGFDGFATKPFGSDSLLDMLANTATPQARPSLTDTNFPGGI